MNRPVFILIACIFPFLIPVDAAIIEAVLDDFNNARNPKNWDGGKIENVTSPKRAGTHAFHHICKGCHRAEFANAYSTVGSTYWYGFSQRYPTGTKGSVVQFARYPPAKCVGMLPCKYSGHRFHLRSNLLFYMQARGEKGECSAVCKKITMFGTAPRNQWIDYVVHAKWTPEKDGFIEIWAQVEGGGYKKVVDYTGRTWWSAAVETLAPYVKLGQYTGNGDLYTDEYRMGDAASSFDEVRPDQQPKPVSARPALTSGRRGTAPEPTPGTGVHGTIEAFDLHGRSLDRPARTGMGACIIRRAGAVHRSMVYGRE